MTDQLQGQAGQRRSANSATTFLTSTDIAGRGPTYERVQRLLEERRARAQAGRARQDGNSEASAPAPPQRRSRPFSSPESDESFAFDQPPYASDAGALGAPGESASPVRPQRRGHGVNRSYWQRSSQFEGRPDSIDEDEADGASHTGASGTLEQHSQQRQFPLDGDDLNAQDERQSEAGPQPDDASSDGRTLAELEKMLNQTMQQFNLEEMRVPTSKDMAFGMAHGNGPFDISDIWAVDSQPSGSQQSASQRQVSASVGGTSRDDGHEVNSYSSTHGERASVSRESSYASGREPQGAHLTVREWHVNARPASAQARLSSPLKQGPYQQPETQHERQPGAGVRPGGRVQSAGGAPSQLRHPHHQFSLLAQHGAQHLRQSHARQVDAEPSGLRRPSTPTGRFPSPQQKPAQSRVTPHYARPLRSATAGSSPGRPEESGPDFTFKPRINARSREIAERLLPIDRETRLEQLCKPRNDRVEQRCQQLRQQKEEEEMRDCTFQPQVSRHSSVERFRSSQPVHDRLYNVKPAWQLKREEILREREQAVLASCTFQPQCGSRQSPDGARRSSSATRRRPVSAAAGAGGGSTPYIPIHQRVADLLRSRNEKLARAQIQMELDGGPATFQPEINRRSVQMAAERQRQQPAEVAALPASERLYRTALEAAARRREAGEESGSAMRDVSVSRDQRNPFHQPQQPGVPAINPRSRALAESSDLPQDFLARQAYLAALGHEKRALYRSLLEESTCTFQPQLLSRAGSVASSCGFGTTPRGGGSRGSGSGGDGDWLSKLAYEDVQRSAARRDALEQYHYGQYTFTPKINERSRRIGRRHSLTDLYLNEDRQAKLERLAAAAEAQRAAQCTFRPNINPRSASLGRQRRGSLALASTEGHEQANKLRSSILTEARALREYDELKDCTFTPAINRTAPKHTGPVAVPGLGRHMELKELARKKREAEESRKAEVWNLRPRSPGPRPGITVPRPFSFDTRVLPWQVPRAQLAQEQMDKELQQRKAIAALKQQRQQQRKVAEERRSAHLQRILQEAQAAPTLAGSAAQVQSASNGGRRRTVSFQSPPSSDAYGRDSPRGVADIPADVNSHEQYGFALEEGQAPYGGNALEGGFDGFDLASVVAAEKLSSLPYS